MKASKILFLYNLTHSLNWLLVNFLLLTILFKNIFLSILLSSFLLIFIFKFKNKNLETILKSILAIFSIMLISLIYIPKDFSTFLKVLSFSFFYIFSLIVLNSEISNIVSIISIVSLLFFYEKSVGVSWVMFNLSFLFIIQSIFVKFLKNKFFYFWENNFKINITHTRKILTNLVSIFLIFIFSLSLFSFLNISFLSKLTLPKELFINNNDNQIKDEKIEIKDNNITILTKRYVFQISNFTKKFFNFIFNSFYFIVFIGFFIILILLGIRFFNLIKAVYGTKKSLIFLIYSFLISIALILSIYFLYKPFEILIKSIVKNSKVENISIPLFEIVQKLRNFLASNQNVTQKTIPISIDIGLISVVLLFIVLSTIFLYLLIFYIYKSNFDERKLELNKIISEFSLERDEQFNLNGSPKEKIIKLYNILIKKLSLIILRLDHETPNEYRIKLKKEKPEFSNEFDIITDNFIISKYSNYNINEDLFYKTFIAFKNLSNKIFKEVYFGREI